MSGFSVSGVVKLANLVRRQLAGPISPAGLARLRTHVAEVIEQIDQLLEEQDLRPEALAPSSRKAYEFLKNVDFGSVATSDSAAEDEHYLANVRLPGIKRFCEDLAARLAQQPGESELREIQKRIRVRLEGIESAMEAQDVRAEHLKDDSRELRSWLGLLARPEEFGRYVSAVGRAKAAFEREARRLRRFCAPMMVRFMPGRTIYRLRADGPGTRVVLPAPMIAFSDEQFTSLAGFALHRGRSEAPVVEAMHGAGYQEILAELEALGCPVQQGRGIHHDLGVSFNRVNAEYFRGRLERPKLVWGESFTMRKFGHYDSIRDAVMVSSSLDRLDVPSFAVDFVVYHELLHRSIGVAYTNGRRAAHTPAFKRQEKAFKLFREAEAVLARLVKAR
jgi:hypothetical protein